jgi:two-component system response regulator QseB
MKFLIVEDESYVAEMLRRALEELGNTCVIAPDADRAHELLADASLDAMTLDLGMPGRAGLSWLEDVATERPDLARRTLVITGRSLEAADVERVTRCGAGVLAKPFTLDGLEQAIRSQIAHPPARRN